MKEIAPSQAFYIKLGRRGQWEEECIYKENTLRFGYREVSHEDCQNGHWDKVEKQLETEVGRSDRGAISRDLNQIRSFYEAGNNSLWVTFHGNHLWWTFADPQVIVLPDASKIRKVIGKWSNHDINGNPLFLDVLRGSLLSMQGFRGTVCSVKEFDYLVNKINGKTPHHILETQVAYDVLVQQIERLVSTLRWKDFELLVDLIFREAGWKRLGAIGRTQKSIDLELLSPVTSEKISVQVKSEASLRDYHDYREKFANMDYAMFFLAVHSPDANLTKEIRDRKEGGDVRLLGPKEVAKLSVDYGLSQWIMAKAE